MSGKIYSMVFYANVMVMWSKVMTRYLGVPTLKLILYTILNLHVISGKIYAMVFYADAMLLTP